MSIDVGCGRESAVSKPNLNLLHRDSFAEKQAGAGMPKVMEADLLEVVLLNHPCEVFRYWMYSRWLTSMAGVFPSVVGVITISSLE